MDVVVILTEPDTAFPVEKFVPVQDVAFVEDHVRMEDWLLVIVVGLTVKYAVGDDDVPDIRSTGPKELSELPIP